MPDHRVSGDGHMGFSYDGGFDYWQRHVWCASMQTPPTPSPGFVDSPGQSGSPTPASTHFPLRPGTPKLSFGRKML